MACPPVISAEVAATETLPRLWLGETLRMERRFTEAIAVYLTSDRLKVQFYTVPIMT